MDNNSRHVPSFNNPDSSRRPFSVTILILVVLSFTSLNALRMVTALRTHDFLEGVTLDVPVVYFVITGAVWTGVGLPLIYSLWARRKWAPPMVVTAVVLYSCYYWFDRLLIAEPAAIACRWPFTLGITFLILFFTFWTLMRPKSKFYFTK